MGWNEPRYEWAPYGDYLDTDPPENEHAHKDCYENYDEKHKELIYRTSYIKPYLVVPDPPDPQGHNAIMGRGYCPSCLNSKENCKCFATFNSK